MQFLLFEVRANLWEKAHYVDANSWRGFLRHSKLGLEILLEDKTIKNACYLHAKLSNGLTKLPHILHINWC